MSSVYAEKSTEMLQWWCRLAARHQFTLRDNGYGANASRGVPVYIPAFASTQCIYPRRDGQAEL